MLRAGLIRQVMAGAYTYLPLGWRAVRKVKRLSARKWNEPVKFELFMPACPRPSCGNRPAGSTTTATP
ncbi:MAG: hypothetical protein CM1200mP2_34680 [Planctomycetaceae bacterium]|nr:MAG: hypothetical protein CM1200mP2_34680 [Planctomycetaceae bacterium]